MTGYVELHAHSFYSLLDGTCSPVELAQRAAQLGMSALALTDHNAVYGVPEFVDACQAVGIRPILGTELTLNDESHLTLLVKDAVGWHNLCQLITLARHNAPKGQARLPKGALLGRTTGLIALSGCQKGSIPQAILQRDDERALQIGRYLAHLFNGDFWLELQNHRQPRDNWLNGQLAALADTIGVGIVATNNVHYSTRDKRRLQDVLVCVENLTTLDAGVGLLRPNADYCLKDDTEMQRLFSRYPNVVTNTHLIAQQCQFTLNTGLQTLPPYPTGERTTTEHLRYLCLQGATERYAQLTTQVQQQLEHELAVIHAAGLSNYFLVVWDIVRFARHHNIPCQGRGSAANSLVAYLLYISPIDPLAHDLVFERFLSAERRSIPDIDIDFCSRRREEVIQYVYAQYGHERAGMACTFSTFRTRQAIRDVTRTLGLSSDHAAAALDMLYKEDAADQNSLPIDKIKPPETNHLIVDLVRQLRGLPRHLGIHNGGMVVTADPLFTRVATEPATMENRFVVQWDKDGLERAGMAKIDILGLRMLSAIHEAVEIINRKKSHSPVDLSKLTYDDPAVYKMISASDTMGVFQVESRAQQNVALPQIRPKNFNDIIATISLIRPGPVQGNMVRPFFNRRSGQEPITYLHPTMRPALEETMGIVLFQEQVVKLGKDVGGFTAGQSELMRRALGKKNAHAAIEQLRVDFVAGARQKNGVPEQIANEIFDVLTAFGGYSFAKSHAAAFAILVYQSAWLRNYFTAEFICAVLNNQPMGFWSPAVLAGDARRHGIDVLPVHLERSQAACIVENGNIRLGFEYVKGFGETAIRPLLSARAKHHFADLYALCRNTRLPKRLIERLIMAGACDHWNVPRRKLIWELKRIDYDEGTLQLAFSADEVVLPNLTEAQAGALEAQTIGLSTGTHVMAQIRPKLPTTILSSRDLESQHNGKRVVVAGLLVIRQQPYTAKGFVFLTLEDEFGLLNIVLRPTVANRYRQCLSRSSLLQVTGIVERQAVINIVASQIALL